MDHNGKSDSVGVSSPGRLTIIFAPCTTNFNNPIEVMYYWHGIKGLGSRPRATHLMILMSVWHLNQKLCLTVDETLC